jgi:hypothetical protein
MTFADIEVSQREYYRRTCGLRAAAVPEHNWIVLRAAIIRCYWVTTVLIGSISQRKSEVLQGFRTAAIRGPAHEPALHHERRRPPPHGRFNGH